MIHAKRRSWHPETVNSSTFCPNLAFKNRYITSKNGSIGRLFATPPLSEVGKKLGKMLKYTPTFKVLSAPLMTGIRFCDLKLKLSNRMRFSDKTLNIAISISGGFVVAVVLYTIILTTFILIKRSKKTLYYCYLSIVKTSI